MFSQTAVQRGAVMGGGKPGNAANSVTLDVLILQMVCLDGCFWMILDRNIRHWVPKRVGKENWK